MRLLRRLAEALALQPAAFDLRFNKGGIAVSGEVTLHGDELYSCSTVESTRHWFQVDLR